MWLLPIFFNYSTSYAVFKVQARAAGSWLASRRSSLGFQAIHAGLSTTYSKFFLVSRFRAPAPVAPSDERRMTSYESGGDDRVRTDDLLRARQALSQLSYTPKETN
jgi:hypothetical protein